MSVKDIIFVHQQRHQSKIIHMNSQRIIFLIIIILNIVTEPRILETRIVEIALSICLNTHKVTNNNIRSV